MTDDDRTRISTTPLPAFAAAGAEATRLAVGGAARRPAAPSWQPARSHEFGDKLVEIGEVLGHTYKIEEFLAKGGMGAVFRARHTILDSLHAVKVIVTELATDQHIVALLKEEAKALGKVKNEAVVEYQGIFMDEHKRRYLVMEFVDGPSLASVLHERRLGVAEVRALRDRVALGLAAAHDRGIFHRDVSPDNIICPGGRVEGAKIIDFGIAKSIEVGEKSAVSDEFAGKYSYVSPEQAGLFGGRIDGRSDMYSLGLVLAAAASGAKLNMGNSLETVQEARRRVPDLSTVPEELRAEIARMLQPNPDDRPAGLRDIVDRAALPAAPGSSTPAPVPAAAPVQPSAAASRAPVYAGIAAVLVAAAGVGGWFLYSDATRALPHAAATQAVARPGAPGSDEAPRGESREPIRPREEVLAPFKAILAPVECGATVEAEMNAEGHYRIRFTGTMRTDATFWERVAQLTANTSIAGLDNQMKSVPPSYCDAIRLVDVAGGAPGETPAIAADRPDLVYKDGEFLVLKVKVPQRVAGYLYVDGLDQDGNVVHLFPTPLRKSNAVKPGDEVQVGASPDKAGPREDVFEMTPPYGTQLVLAIASQKPLFASSRQQIENASDYLSVLRAAMDKTADSSAAATVASYRFLDIVPK